MTDYYTGFTFIKRNTDDGVLMEVWQDMDKWPDDQNNSTDTWKQIGSWVQERPGTRVVMNDVVGTYIGTAEDKQKQDQGIDTFSISEQMKDIV